MEEYSRRELAMKSDREVKERYVTDVRLGRDVRTLRVELERRGYEVPDGSNPRALVE